MLDSADIEADTVKREVNGTGPFRWDSWEEGQKVTVKANEDYWGDVPQLSEVEMRVIPDESSILSGMQAGAFDLGIVSDPSVAQQADPDAMQVLSQPTLSYHVLQLNGQRGPLRELKVRQAIACAIDRQQVVDQAYLGEGEVTGPITSPAFEYDPTEGLPCDPPDPEAATDLLEEAGYGDGFTLDTLVMVGEYATATNIAQSVQGQLSEIGIELDLQQQQTDVYVDKWLAADYDAAVALNGGGTDPYLMYARYFTSDASLKAPAGLSDPTLDQLLRDANATTDEDERARPLRAAAAGAAEAVPVGVAAAQPVVLPGRRGRRRLRGHAHRVAGVPHDGHGRGLWMTWRYLTARLAGTVATLVGVAVLVFVVLRALPGDAVTARLGTEAGVLTDEQLAALEQYYGIDQPVWQQFTSWVSSVLTGNLGVSADSGAPVDELILSALPVTLELAVLAMLISTPIGIALGMLAASRPGKARDVSVQSLGLVGLALPEFVVASVMVAALASAFSYFPDPGSYVSVTDSISGNLSQMLYPSLVLSIGLVATIMRTTRSAYLQALNTDFVRTARGKGLSPQRIRLRHVLHNASIPIVTILGIQFGYLLGGTVIIEQIFALPGLGRLLLNGILEQDYAVVQSTVLFIAVAFVLVNLLVDLTYRALDPRARLQ